MKSTVKLPHGSACECPQCRKVTEAPRVIEAFARNNIIYRARAITQKGGLWFVEYAFADDRNGSVTVANWNELAAIGQTVYYACYGLIDDDDGIPQPYVVPMPVPVPMNDDGSPQLPDTWQNSGPYFSYNEAFGKAIEIAANSRWPLR